MNFVETFKEGQKGKNKGLPMGKALGKVARAIGNIQKKSMHVVASAPKVGKTTYIDNAYVIEPCVYVLNKNSVIDDKIDKLNLKLEKDPSDKELIDKKQELKSQKIELDLQYYSYEIDRVTKEFDFVCHFLNRIYNISTVPLSEGTFRGESYVPVDSSFLQGIYVYDDSDDKPITVPKGLEDKIKEVYTNWIIPIFGKYDANNKRVKEGLMDFHENRNNPTGIRNQLMDHARKHGKFVTESHTSKGKTYTRTVGFNATNPNWHCIVILDHCRKLVLERQFNLKQTVDKMSDYFVELRNFCKFTIVPVIHLNRSMAGIDRRKLDGDKIYPMDDDLKETGNLGEDCDYLFTLFNPNDDKYALNKHFGDKIRNARGRKLYPDMRTIHLVAGRRANAPQHFRINMHGATKSFSDFKLVKE